MFLLHQEIWIILEFGALRNCLAVRRTFRLHYGLSLRKVPSIKAFERLVERFITTDGELRGTKQSDGAKTIIDEDLVKKWKTWWIQRFWRNSLFQSQILGPHFKYLHQKLGESWGKGWVGIPTNRYIGELKTKVNVFAESFWLHQGLFKPWITLTCVRHIRDRQSLHYRNRRPICRRAQQTEMNWDGEKWNVLSNVQT